MVNAFDIMRSRISKGGHVIKNVLQYDGEVWMDSGGFQFLRHGKIPDIEDLARVYDQYWDVRYFLNLDYPPSPPTDDEHDLELKLRRSLHNYEYLAKKFDNILPVIHYHWRTNIIIKYVIKYLDFNPNCIAIGGLVPYVLISRGVPKDSRRSALRFLLNIKRKINMCIHVLGLGSPPIINPILKLINIDSTDTSTWRVKAAYGKVVMPGGGERHVSGRAINFGGKEATSDDLMRLYAFLKATGFPMIDQFNEIVTSFEYRALVNAWVVLNSFEVASGGVFRTIYDELAREVAEHIIEGAR